MTIHKIMRIKKFITTLKSEVRHGITEDIPLTGFFLNLAPFRARHEHPSTSTFAVDSRSVTTVQHDFGVSTGKDNQSNDPFGIPNHTTPQQ